MPDLAIPDLAIPDLAEPARVGRRIDGTHDHIRGERGPGDGHREQGSYGGNERFFLH